MTTSASPAIDVAGLDCGYATRTVLSDCDLNVSQGEVVALIGPNGSGKSTLMKTIAGAIPPLKGTVRLIGNDVSSMGKMEIARRIGYVPQLESPAFDFTVREVVLMGRMPHSDAMFESKEDVEAAERAMERADCIGLAHRPMSELSGGEGQRARIARALAQEAPILLMDEPTTHLDVRHQIDVGKSVRNLAKEGLAILVAVHDLNWAANFASRAVLLSGGRIALDAQIPGAFEDRAFDDAFGVAFERVRTNGVRLLAEEGL